jgi:hypothetical protein
MVIALASLAFSPNHHAVLLMRGSGISSFANFSSTAT